MTAIEREGDNTQWSRDKHVDHATAKMGTGIPNPSQMMSGWHVIAANAEKCKVWKPIKTNDNLSCTRERSMFKKPLSQIKSFSPLRSSDRRRFQNDAYNAYPSLKDKCSQEGASPLMPDPLLSAKFTTSNNVNGVVHVANNKPLWLKLEGFPPIPTGITFIVW